MLDLAILGLLRDRERHGYELRKQLGELLGSRGAMSFGSLYPALARLEKAGLVKAVEANVAVPPVPSSGSLAGELAAFRVRPAATSTAGRSKKVYGITEAGDAQLRTLLAEGPTDERTFGVQLAFCRHLPPLERLALFERRRRQLAEELEARTATATRLDRYLGALRDRDTRHLTNDLAWLDELILSEQAAIQEDQP
ncbi:MAG: helix-turn-helix transcriptional regulator [Acidimicrobiia bacterium]|nr:helix-turn-helix transcriptional regulator [Acidimicrobiia bacterium]